MITAVRSLHGDFSPTVAPMDKDWNDAKEECERRCRATDPSQYVLTPIVVSRAYEFLLKHFSECHEEIQDWTIRQVVEAYLDF